MFVLIADDESPKLDSITIAMRDFLPSAEFGFARSVRAALAAVQRRHVDLLILDMSLPTFDVAPGEQGGRPQGFGGVEVLRYLDFYSLQCPVVVVTQYEAFLDKGKHVDLSALAQRLAVEHPKSFREIIYYGGGSDELWKRKLEAAIARIVRQV